MPWTDRVERAIEQQDSFEIADTHLTVRVRWLADFLPEDLSDIRVLLEAAYTDRSMWSAFEDCRRQGRPLAVFTLHDRAGKMLATRSFGEIDGGAEMWGDHARALGYESPVCGACFTVRRDCRGKGLGALFRSGTMAWIKANSGLDVLFGDTVSRRAMVMYRNAGAWFFEPDVRRLCMAYGAEDLPSFFAKTPALEYVPDDLDVRYVWILSESVEGKIRDLGYLPPL